MKIRSIYIIGTVFLVVAIIPYFILGKSSYFLTHDGLDSVHVAYKTLVESGKLFAPSSEIVDIYGVPRGSFSKELNLALIPYLLLSPVNALITNIILLKIIGFIGLYFFLTRYVLKDELTSIMIAAAFAFLNHWEYGAATVTSLPLAAYAFLNIKNRRGMKFSLLLLLVIPFYSSFILSYMFFVSLVGIYICYDYYKTKKMDWLLTFALVAFTSIFILSEYRLILNIIDPVFISHRVERVIKTYDVATAFSKSINFYKNNQYHSPSLHNKIILPVIYVSLFAALLFRCSLQVKKIIFSLFGLVGISLVYGFWKYEELSLIRNISLFNMMNLSRYSWLTPFFWYALFAYAIKVLISNIEKLKNKSNFRTVGVLLACLQMLYVFTKSDIYRNYKQMLVPTYTSYSDFYFEDLISKLKGIDEVKKSNLRLISIGIHPAVAIYHELRVRDFYLTTYPLDLKHKLMDIQDLELMKNERNKKYIQEWGNRNYIIPHQLNAAMQAEGEIDSLGLELSYDRALEHDIGYILSKYEINNDRVVALSHVKIDSKKEIYLYKIIK
jgi:hypothetical protein